MNVDDVVNYLLLILRVNYHHHNNKCFTQAAQYDASTGACYGLASVPPMRFALDNSTLPHTLFVGLSGGEGPRSVALRIQCDPFAAAPVIKSLSLDPAIVYVSRIECA